jgi:hypothetical protein
LSVAASKALLHPTRPHVSVSLRPAVPQALYRLEQEYQDQRDGDCQLVWVAQQLVLVARRLQEVSDSRLVDSQEALRQASEEEEDQEHRPLVVHLLASAALRQDLVVQVVLPLDSNRLLDSKVLQDKEGASHRQDLEAGKSVYADRLLLGHECGNGA